MRDNNQTQIPIIFVVCLVCFLPFTYLSTTGIGGVASTCILLIQLENSTARRKKKYHSRQVIEVRNQALLIVNTSHNVRTSPSGRWPAALAALLGTVQEKSIYLAVAEDWVYTNTAGPRAAVQQGNKNSLQAHDETGDFVKKQNKKI